MMCIRMKGIALGKLADSSCKSEIFVILALPSPIPVRFRIA